MQKLLPRLVLAAILAVAALLRLWRLDEGGVLIPYYFAGVRSMAASWHNFFFNAFDPAGFVSLDKPPVAFWLQALSVKLFGFSRLSVLLPQAVEGLAAIALLGTLVRCHFGAAAGLLAALFLALNPISIAVDRSNNTESCLVLALLLAVWALFRAIETGRTRWLLASAALIGIGFNIKMLVAIGVVPVFALAYLIWARPRLTLRIVQLGGAAAVLAAVSLAWCVACDSIPAASRPFVDSTAGNSTLELAVGHNFAERFVRAPRPGQGAARPVPSFTTVGPPSRDYAPAGVFRLVTPPMASQTGWLLPLALAAFVAAWYGRPDQSPALAVWAGWTLVYGAVFSAAGGLFHPYYLAVMAPPVCALAAIGFARLAEPPSRGHWAILALPVAVALTALWQAYIVGFYLSGSLTLGQDWLQPALVAVAVLVGCVLVAARRSRPAVRAALAAGGAVVLALPVAWSLGTVTADGRYGGFPSARPPFLTAEAEDRRGRFNEIAGAVVSDPKLLDYLARHHGEETYLLATVNSRLAAPIVIATGMPVMSLGGFNGMAPILQPEDFARRVAAKAVRYALTGDGSAGLRRVFGDGAQRPIVDWVRANGRLVAPAEWRSPMTQFGGRPAETVGAELYDLRSDTPGAHLQTVERP